MSKRLLSVPLLIIAAAGADVSAQTAASDSWSRPASASSTAPSYGSGSGLRDASGGSDSHFKFKEQRDARPQRNAALEASGKAPVMGGNELGRDGRPTVSCARTPMDPACR
ncbi:hypothetical protein ACO2Q2_07000 [Dyella sp. KRB-257]|uniref:hypothetical protein n=1 Tax=Dyella sp. KRB-257 TaxID=3400915 RepID=UPI003C125471